MSSANSHLIPRMNSQQRNSFKVDPRIAEILGESYRSSARKRVMWLIRQLKLNES